MDAPTAPAAPEPAEPRSPFRPNRLTSGIVAGGAAVAMVLAGLGIASAQTDGSTTTDPPAASTEGTADRPHRHHRHPIATARIASVIGITAEDLRAQLAQGKSIAAIAGDRTDEVTAAMVEEATERIDAAVAAGRLTQAQADERKAGLEERVTALVNRTPPASGERGDKPGRGAARLGLAVAADTLGMSVEALRTELRAGMSLAAVAGDRTPALIEALVADAQARIDQAVTDGKLTAEQATERKANLTERITAKVNAVRPAGAGPHGRGHGHPPAPPSAEAGAEPASVTA